MSPPRGDDVLVRRASRGIAVQTTALVAAVVLLIAVLVTVLVVRGQAKATDDLLRGTVETADDVGDPPTGSWLVIAAHGRVATSPGLPGGLAGPLERLRGQVVPLVTFANLRDSAGGEYRAASTTHDNQVVQVVTNLASQHAQRDRLLRAMLLAAVLGLLAAGVIGVYLGRRAVRPLAQALGLQRAFVADASHELRTPLTLLSTRAQLLDRAVQQHDVGEQVRADSRGVVHDVQRLGEVVEDLLVAADPRAENEREPVDLRALVVAVVDSARAHAQDAGITLTAELEGTDGTVLGSPPALRRAVLSLVDNAIDHTPVGGQVTVGLHRAGRSVVVSVSDTGTGVSPQDAPDVLRRFHSGGQRSGRAHYGLGLALTHDVADRHGGQLRLAETDVGARFELVLPLAR